MNLPVSYYEIEHGMSFRETNSPVMLGIGAPGDTELENIVSYMKEAFAYRLANATDRRVVQAAQYGRNEGDPYLIYELHKFLCENYGNTVDREDLFITNGASTGVWDILARFLRDGDTIFVEDPTYKAMIPALESSNFKMVEVSMDDDGMIVDELEKKLANLHMRETCDRYPFRAAVYLIPTCQNPTTRTMTQSRQKKLIDLARKYDLLLIADDVYNLLWYADLKTDNPVLARPPRTLYSNDCKYDSDYKGNVISVGSFSKFLGPGFRLGWYEMPPKLLSIFCGSYRVESGAGKNPFLGGLVAAAFELGLVQKHLDEIKALYATRMRNVHDIIIKTVGEHGVKCHLPNAGYFLWIRLPESVTAESVLEIANGEVSAFPGYKCSLSGSYTNCLRISVTFYEADVLYPAVRKLCQFIILAVNKNNEI